MSIPRALLLALLACLHYASLAGAQGVTRVEAAIADLEADGRPDNGELFLFDGCPQDDPDGLAVFEAVRDMSLDPWGLAELAGNLTFRVYPNCGYTPLDEWYSGVFERLHAARALGPASSFVIRLGLNEARLIKSDMQEALLRAAEDPNFMGGRPREQLVGTALYYRPRELWLDESISALRRAIPRQSIADITYRLSREFGSEFYERLVAEAPTLNDEVFFTVIHALGSEIQDERADPNARGMEALRVMAATRARVPWDSLPRAHRPPIR